MYFQRVYLSCMHLISVTERNNTFMNCAGVTARWSGWMVTVQRPGLFYKLAKLIFIQNSSKGSKK